jgi:hypothetical protein
MNKGNKERKNQIRRRREENIKHRNKETYAEKETNKRKKKDRKGINEEI